MAKCIEKCFTAGVHILAQVNYKQSPFSAPRRRSRRRDGDEIAVLKVPQILRRRGELSSASQLERRLYEVRSSAVN